MKKIATITFLSTIILLWFLNSKKAPNEYKNNQVTAPTIITPSPTPHTKNKIPHTKYSVFMPYWTLPEEEVSTTLPKIDTMQVTASNTTLVYFGVTVDKNGNIDTNDTGYNRLNTFISATKNGGNNTLLTLRLLDEEVIERLLDNNTAQKKTAAEVAKLAKIHGFSGIVVDLEVKAIPTKETVADISKFTQTLSRHFRTEGLSVFFAIYGDTYYRARPYDVTSISSFVDGLFIMAYDFHKSYGTPGPGFPLGGASEFGYDMSQMLADFSVIPKEKLTIIFGMYGKEWIVDEKNRPLKAARIFTRAQIQQTFFPNCSFAECKLQQDTNSAEGFIRYKKDDKTHVVWYEDELSVAKKIEFLKKNGIFSYSFWAFGYY